MIQGARHRSRSRGSRRDSSDGDDWWREGSSTRSIPRSFADGNGDGVGDLAGILDHLDHLGRGPDGLGIDAIWLSPIYPSPGLDGGYDVADHARVDPVFGSEADFDRLVAEAHRRGIRIVLDLVLNHTSDQHRWFRSSRASRDGPHADWYIWADPAGRTAAGRPRPPNNWRSVFGGPAWTLEAGARAVLPPHLPCRAARRELAAARPRRCPARDGPGMARSRASMASGSMCSTSWSRTRTLRSNPVGARPRSRLGAPRPSPRQGSARTSRHPRRGCGRSWTRSPDG